MGKIEQRDIDYIQDMTRSRREKRLNKTLLAGDSLGRKLGLETYGQVVDLAGVNLGELGLSETAMWELTRKIGDFRGVPLSFYLRHSLSAAKGIFKELSGETIAEMQEAIRKINREI